MSQQYRFASVSGAAFALSVFTICIFLLTVSQADSVATNGSQQKLAPAAVFTVNSTADTNDGVCDSATPGGCTLRDAINAANANAGTDTIEFNLGIGTPSIAVGSSGSVGLPPIIDPVIINGNTGGATRIELNGTSTTVGAIDGLVIGAGSTTVRALVINRFLGNGIVLAANGGNTIEDCYIGTNAAGIADLGNRSTGVEILNDSPGNFILRSVISGNDLFGIGIIGATSTGNTIQGNYIDVDATGSMAVGNNRVGITCGSSDNRIGGAAPGDRNVISGNVQCGIFFAPSSANNIAQGNFIGLNAAGSAAVGNGEGGVLLEGAAQNNLIGGGIAGEGNIISGNLRNGINLRPRDGFTPSGTRIEGNIIGTNTSGAAGLGNVLDGVRLEGVSNNTVGGSTGMGSEGNNISGNGQNGVRVFNGGNNEISLNVIGSAPLTGAALPNGENGVLIDNSPNNTVIGCVIAGNTEDGVQIINSGATGNSIKASLIGINSSGLAMGNRDGVVIDLGASGNQIGDATSIENIISSNRFRGVLILGTGTTNNLVANSRIGPGFGSATGLGNAREGVRITAGATDNTIGCSLCITVISGNGTDGVLIDGSGTTGNRVDGCLIGTASTGAAALPNGANGVQIRADATNNVIGGPIHNLISGNTGSGVVIAANSNRVEGNFIGLDSTHTAALGNDNGVVIIFGASSNNIVGNFISGNLSNGVIIEGHNNFIRSNRIGTNLSGAADLGNGGEGVLVSDAPNNVIGSPGAGNVISGNTRNGIRVLKPGSTGTLIQANLIGTNSAGDTNLGNSRNGIVIDDGASNNTIGGVSADKGNLISGNDQAGIVLGSALFNTANNLVQGNRIGTNSAGTAALPNAFSGVTIKGGASNNQIGGLTSTPGTAPGNLISGNGNFGVFLEGSGATANLVQGNAIGTDITGTIDVGNVTVGVTIVDSASNAIGGTAAGARNVISGNNSHGVLIRRSNNNIVHGNFIGVDITGTTALGNSLSGIAIDGVGASSNKIGGTGSGAGNTIAFNGTFGIAVLTGTFNTILSNSIFSNGGLGIGLEGDGVTPNDPCDGDSGGNNLQNFPLLTSATTSGGVTTIQGTINGEPNTTYIIEFFSNPGCDPSGHGEGRDLIGSTIVTTDLTCNAAFTKSISPSVPVGSVVTATATVPDKDTSEFSNCRQVLDPTAIEFAGFLATGYDDGVVLRWQTGYEVGNLGFNVYRERRGERIKLNKSLIAGSALLVSAGTPLTAGHTYSWLDQKSESADAAYWLEDVDLNGQTGFHGPFFIARSVVGKLPPSEKQSRLLGEIGNAGSLTDEGVPLEQRAKMAANVDQDRVGVQADLAGRQAIKLFVKEEGWYHITKRELVAAGFDQNADPRLLQMFVEGKEVPISIAEKQNGGDDFAVEFYGVGLDSAASDRRAYWLVWGAEPGRRIELTSGSGAVARQSGFPVTVERRDRTVYFPALRNGDTENFFGAVIARDSVDQILAVHHQDGAADPRATLEVMLQGVTLSSHRVNVMLEGEQLGEINFAGQAQGVERFEFPQPRLRDGQNRVTLAAEGGPSDVSLVYSIRLTYQHALMPDDNVLRFTAEGGVQVTIGGFTTGEIRALDITEPADPKEVAGEAKESKAGYDLTITSPLSGRRTLLAFTKDHFKSPARLSANIPSSWRQPNHGADLLIITRREFFDSLKPLVVHRQAQGMSVALIDAEDLYDEFSFGHKTPQALRDFLEFVAGNWKKKPRFALLAGDASVDPKNYLGFGDSDVVPTKLVDTVYMETASDEWLADFNGDGLGELMIGRLPARTADESARMVGKIISFERSRPPESLLLVADANDGYNFEATSQQLRPLVPANIRVEEIARGHMDSATAKAKLLEAIGRGQKLINYVGHGSVDRWRGDLLTNADAFELENADGLTLFVMMTCLSGYFQDAALDSLAESLLKAEGGAVAVWASSGMTLPNGQAEMNQQLFRLMFGPQNPTLGDAVAGAKAATFDIDVRRTWMLLGDPSMRLR